MTWKLLVVLLVNFAFVACSEGRAPAIEPMPRANTEQQAALSVGGEKDHSSYVGLAGAQPYILAGPYASVLPECMLVTSPEYSCTLAKLPFLVHEGKELSVERIMSRVVVSHKWMGARFQQLLQHLPGDALALFRSVTAVVIADDIYASFFSNITGAVYLAPTVLWQTASEKHWLQSSASHAAATGPRAPLMFRSWSRYLKDGIALADNRSWAAVEGERSVQNMLLPAASLLFHELAHANDFFPPIRIVDADHELSVYALAGLQKGYRTSDLLYQQSPLLPGGLAHWAQVMYLNKGGFSDAELTQTAADLAAQFDPQAANDDYAFVHQFEDVAMLFEEAMMAYYFQVDRDVAYLDVPSEPANADCNDYKVAWGMRNRIRRTDIKARAQWVVEAIMPGASLDDYFTSNNAPTYLQAGLGWCESASARQ